MDHPLGERLAHATALKEAGHNTAGEPVVGYATNRTHQWVAVRRKGESAVDPVPDTHFLQYRIAVERHLELICNTVGIFLNQFYTVVPRCSVDVPVLVIDLVDPDEDTVLVLAHVGEALKIDGHRQLEVHGLNFRDRFGQEVMVLEWRQRQIETHHSAHLFGP